MDAFNSLVFSVFDVIADWPINQTDSDQFLNLKLVVTHLLGMFLVGILVYIDSTRSSNAGIRFPLGLLCTFTQAWSAISAVRADYTSYGEKSLRLFQLVQLFDEYPNKYQYNFAIFVVKCVILTWV